MDKKQYCSYLRAEILTKMKLLKEADPEAFVTIIDTNISPDVYDFSNVPINDFRCITFSWENNT